MNLIALLFQRRTAGILAALLLVFTLWQIAEAVLITQANSEQAQVATAEATERIAGEIANGLNSLSLAANDVRDYLGSPLLAPLSTAEIQAALQLGSINHDGFYSLGLAFQQGVVALDTESANASNAGECGAAYCRYAPFVTESGQSAITDRIDNYYDYITERDGQWFNEAAFGDSGWTTPQVERAYDRWVMKYTEPLTDESGAVLGTVFVDVDLDWFKGQIENHDLWHNGYAIIVNRNGGEPAILYHGLVSTETVREYLEGQMLNGVAAEYAPDFVTEVFSTLMELPASSRVVNQLTGADAWFNRASITDDLELFTIMNHTPGIESLEYEAISAIRNQNAPPVAELWWRQLLNLDAVNDSGLVTLLVSIVLLACLSYGYFAITFERTTIRRRIIDSAFLSVVLTVGIVAIWNIQYRLDPNHTAQSSAISNSAVVREFMREYSKISLQRGYAPPRYIPTGIFIQSIEFVSASNVSLTGYVWQRYLREEDVPTEPQVIFAEAISADIEPAYTEIQGEEIVQGWYFETELRERFDYAYYPFDRQSVWVRIWPKSFTGNVVLVPDFASYDSLNPRSLPGLEDNFPLFGWEPERSYFDIRINRYNSNFGQSDYLSRGTVPELYFNIDVRRSFLNPFVSHLFPLTVVLLMLFALIVTMSKSKEHFELLGFSVSSVVQSCTALFFVILIAHVQLREELSSNSIVYLEFFYFVSYIVLLMVTINSILFSANMDLPLIQYRNNLIPKVLYWPFIVAVLFVCTALTFWI